MSPVTRGRNDLWGGLILAIGVVLAVTAFAGVSLFQIGAVAFFSWLALARKQGWAWLPAAFFGFHIAQDLLDGVGGSLFFPLMVVAAGVLMLSRDRLSKNATVGILIMLAVIGIASSDRDNPPPPPLEPDPPPAAPGEVEPPDASDFTKLDLDGRDLVIDAGNRAVHLSKSRNSELVIGDDDVEIIEEPEFVLIELDSEDEALEVRVPAESSVTLRTNSGDVTAVVDAFSLDINSVSGDVDVDLSSLRAVLAETKAGDITHGPYTDTNESPTEFEMEGPGSPIRIQTISGDISVEPA